MKKRTILIVASIVVLIAIALRIAYRKAQRLIEIFQKITIAPVAVGNFNASLSRIRFTIDLKLSNPSPDAFEVNGLGVGKLKEVSVFYKGVFVAKSMVNITEIAIPAKDELILHDIPVVVNEPLLFLASNIALAYEMINNFDQSKLSTTAVISVAGYEIEI